MSSQGSSPETDWRCTQTRSFTGDVTSDGQVSVTFSPRFTPGGCSVVVGGERATGSMSNGSINVALPYRATCEMTPGNGPSWDLEIAATVTLTPW